MLSFDNTGTINCFGTIFFRFYHRISRASVRFVKNVNSSRSKSSPSLFQSPDPGTWMGATVARPCRVVRRTPGPQGWCCRWCTRTRCHSRRGIRLADETSRSGRQSPNWSAASFPVRFLWAESRSSADVGNTSEAYFIYVVRVWSATAE